MFAALIAAGGSPAASAANRRAANGLSPPFSHASAVAATTAGPASILPATDTPSPVQWPHQSTQARRCKRRGAAGADAMDLPPGAAVVIGQGAVTAPRRQARGEMFKHPFAGQGTAVRLRGKRADAPVEAWAKRADGEGAGGDGDAQMPVRRVARHNRPGHRRLPSVQQIKGTARGILAQAAADMARSSAFVGQHFGHRDGTALAPRFIHRQGGGQGAQAVLGVDQGAGLAADHRHEMS